ncbi:uncharacterized protein LOC116291888 [Actinia tenebrosa]|uniref:Uncharacterized protein LOC116291888 n=1 Tax=Actinia tenebrosa TaxID=6105 RepID=A0A6P8HJD6_ACTTE|nr:uncharacterized protein LOC116291888 [Actinia tenebrosa]XP_031554979.1 uncharacterized protein LOC116291888 [Actinia tenebrosa]
MDIGNEKQNNVTNQPAGLATKRQGQWRAVCGADQRFYFVNLDTNVTQWLPPVDLWSSKFGLPYGWEAGVTNSNTNYFINHVNKISTLEDPRSEAEQASTHLQMAAARARIVQIKRDPSLGFGFVAGSEKPVVIRSVISGGPSHGKLFSNDQILKVNGVDVSEVPQERVISLIKACSGELEIHVVSSEDLQDAKNQGPRRSSLMSRATRERRRSSPVNVRFADDMVQYIGPAEQARRASLPILPNVLKVFLENGQTRSFHYNPKTTVQEIFNTLGPKLDIKAMEYFCLVLSGPQKNQLSFLQNHEKVSEIYLNRNCSRSSWVCKLRICFIPRHPNELLEKDPVAFDYLYDQISKDIVDGLFEIDLRYDLAIKLAALHMQQKATEAKNKMPTKISVKSVEKDFDGLGHFLPENIINGVKLKDLRKVLEQQIKFNQSLAGLGQRYLTSKECKKQYLNLASELVCFGGKYFNVILYSNDGGAGSDTKSRKARHQEATVLVSPKYGLSQMVKGKINVLCQLAELEQISEFSISFHAEGKRLLTITMADNKDLVLLMKPLDSMDLVTFIVGYQKLWNCTIAKLTIKGEKQEPLAPLTDHDIPLYASLHKVIPDTWSYPSFLQVPGSNSDHHFNLDLTKDPPKYTPSNAGDANGPVNDSNSVDVDSNHIAAKRSSEEINADETDEEVAPSESGSGKRFKVDNSGSSNEQGTRTSLESENDSEMVDSPSKTRTLYSIAEESQNLKNEDQEQDEDDYISQLTMAEEIWRRNRNERIEFSLEASSSESQKESQDFESSENASPDEIKESNQILNDNIENEKDGEPDRMVGDDADSDEEIEPFYEGRKSSHQEHNKDDDEVNLGEGITGNGEYDGEKLEHEVIRDFLKKDYVEANELQQGRSVQSLDINDIDLDDVSGTSAKDSLDLLADFSFTGDIDPHENGSPADMKNGEDFLKYEDKFQYDHDDDEEEEEEEDDYDHDDRNEENTGNLLKIETEFSSNVGKHSSDGFTITTSEKDKPSFEDTFDRLSSEKIDFFDKKENFGDSGERDLDDKKDYASQNKASSKEDEEDKNIDENGVNEVGIQLLSYKQREDQDILAVRRPVMPKETNDFNDELLADGSIVDGGNGLEEKDSDLSSLSSQGSNNVDSGPRYQDSRVVSEERNKMSNFKAKVSIDEVDSLVESDTKMSNNLSKAKQKGTDENKVLLSQSYLNEVEQHGRRKNTLPGRMDQDDEDNSPKTLISTEHDNDDSNEVSKMDRRIDDVVDVTTRDLKNVMDKSSPIVLLLGNDPGDSEDTLDNLNKDPTDNGDAILTKDDIDFQEFSLMDWIIPSPPGSTEELLDSDIFVASPPPISPTFKSISSPPVELNDNLFNELEIDGMILPPPPMASSFRSVIRIVSPPPSHVDGSIQKEEPISTGKYKENIINDIEKNRQKLENLKLEDSKNVADDEFVPVNLTQCRSSESSSSIFTDDYNSAGSMVSCYSLSNDSQRTSEDEFFDDERNEVFGEIQDLSVRNVALFKTLEPGITGHKDIRVNPFEETSSSQPPEKNMEMQQERNDELKNCITDGMSVLARDKSSENGVPEVIDQIPLEEKPVTDIPRNGMPYENDYDCLDEVPFTMENDTLVNKGFETKPHLPKQSQHRAISLSTNAQKNDKQFVEDTEQINAGPVGLSGKFEKSHVEQVSLDKSTTDKGYVKNRTKLFEGQEKPVDFNRMKNKSPTISPKMKDNVNGTKKQQTLTDNKVDESKNLNVKTPKQSLKPSVTKQQTIPVFLPCYLLKESNDKPSEEEEVNPPSSNWNLELESEAVTDEDKSPRLQRKAPVKRTMNNKMPTQHYKDMVYNEGKLDVGSSDEYVKIDGAGAVDKDHLGENNGEMGLDDESSVFKRECLSAKIETADLTERMKLRLQGCVDDCQSSALKSSYFPYANSNKWKEGVHDNAVLLGSDLKLLNINVQEMNSDVIPTIKSSLESLQSLVSSFVLASTSHQRISLYSVRMLAGILNDVVSLYNDLIVKVEEAARFYPNESRLQSVAEKMSSMTALIASLRRTLKRL